MKVWVLPDKYKGSLSASEVAAAMAEGWHLGRSGDEVRSQPISDGGDGFGEILSGFLGGEPCEVETVDAAGRRITAVWWWVSEWRTAIVESANVIGMARLSRGEYHPFDLDTRGLGKVLGAVADAGAVRCLIGIGGSATNDAGFGVAVALGWRFYDGDGAAITRWTDLDRLNVIERPSEGLSIPELIVAVDVNNPLLGERGASRVYGPQKGLKEGDMEKAEGCLRQLAERMASAGHCPEGPDAPGSGAAGGLGFGLRCFLGAHLEGGFGLLARWARLTDRIREADVVLTGEGKIDASTLMGKGVGEIAGLCREAGVPCLGIGGAVEENAPVRGSFHRLAAITESGEEVPEAAESRRRLRDRVAALAREWGKAM